MVHFMNFDILIEKRKLFVLGHANMLGFADDCRAINSYVFKYSLFSLWGLKLERLYRQTKIVLWIANEKDTKKNWHVLLASVNQDLNIDDDKVRQQF